MNCPRCQNLVQENERFCPVCGLQLPESRPQQPAAPQYIPVSPAPTPVPSYSPIKAQPKAKRRPVVLGIIGFALSFSALSFGLLAPLFALLVNMADLADVQIDRATLKLFSSYAATYAVIGLIMGAISITFGAIAKSKLNEEPERYMGGGMYTAAIVLGIIGAVFALLAFIL